MREIKLGEKQLRIRATPLALLFYRQEFNADLIGNLIKLRAIATDPSNFDSVIFLQIIWAMAKADNAKELPSFYDWITGLDTFDFGDQKLLMEVMEEAEDGFFRGGKKQ